MNKNFTEIPVLLHDTLSALFKFSTKFQHIK
jgi:hypothetical protein